MKRLLIIDANALLHRAFHALPSLSSKTGVPVGGVYGFFSILIKALSDLKPDYLVACFDLPKPTLRHKKYPEYKATRPKTDPELIRQFPILRAILESLGIPLLEKEGYEADDAIGTVVTKIAKERPDIENIILTGDLDTLQLVNSQTKILTPQRGLVKPIIYDEKRLKERFGGIKPEQIIDYKGLKGDPSDNIPGVPGVGEKTALKLIKRFGSLEKIYQALENKKELKKLKEEKFLSQTLIKKLKENKDLAFFSKELATIQKDVPLNFDLSKAKWQPDPERIKKAFREIGFPSLYQRFLKLVGQEKKEEKKEKPFQERLF